MTRDIYAGVMVVLVVATLLAGCGQRNGTGQSPPTPSASISATSTSESTPLPPSPTPTPPSSSSLPKPTKPTTPVLVDGRYPAFLTAIDTHARTVTFDVIQYLTGAEAAKAFHRDHPDITEGPPNGFYIVNENPRLRTLPVHRNADVEVIWLDFDGEPTKITFDRLPGYFVKDPVKDKYLWYDPFWLTVHAGRVVAMSEQYIP